jgi:hypothetical protein
MMESLLLEVISGMDKKEDARRTEHQEILNDTRCLIRKVSSGENRELRAKD